MRKTRIEQLKRFVGDREGRESRFPENILIETLSRCNLDCVMCPRGRLSRPSGVMSSDLWRRIVDEIAEKAPRTKVWPAFMGEPFAMGRKTFEYYRYAASKGVDRINLNTNLLLFKEGWIDEFFDSNIENLLVSMDGVTPDTYGKIRVKGKLDTLLRKLDLILDGKQKRGLERPIVSLQFIVMEQNEHEEAAFIDYWKRSGRDVELKIKPRIGWSYGVDPYAGMINFTPEERVPCTWLLRQMVVYWDGKVPQCTGDWDGRTFCGDLRESSIQSIWMGELERRRKNHLDRKFTLPICQGCNDWQAGPSVSIKCR